MGGGHHLTEVLRLVKYENEGTLKYSIASLLTNNKKDLHDFRFISTFTTKKVVASVCPVNRGSFFYETTKPISWKQKHIFRCVDTSMLPAFITTGGY